MASEGRGVAASALEGAQDLYQVELTLKKLCEFSTVWADWAVLGSTKNFYNFADKSYFWTCVSHAFMD